MFADFLISKLELDYSQIVLAFDPDNLIERGGGIALIKEKGFELLDYKDPEEFRYVYESSIRDNDKLKAVIRVIDPYIYVPYDIRKRSNVVNVAFGTLFPKLNENALRSKGFLDLDLLVVAYGNYFGNSLNEGQTLSFLTEGLYAADNVKEYVGLLVDEIHNLLCERLRYADWFVIAEKWAKVRMMVDGGHADMDIKGLAADIDQSFKTWLMDNYRYLSASYSTHAPVMVYKIADFIRAYSGKAALIMVDGMSVEDWFIFAAHAGDFKYDVEMGYSFAFIPTITSISRQSIFSGQLPINHHAPFSLAHEEKQWRQFWLDNGFKDAEIFFGRGINVDVPASTKIAGIIINTLDDIMHGQIQGQEGMYRDIASWASRGELQGLIQRLLAQGFQVYITSDHGNIEAVGQGRPPSEGVLTEITGLRARIYQDFAQTDKLKANFRVMEYPGIYLPKEYRYILCDGYSAFAAEGENAVCHGGMTIEEVIVPFIEVKGVVME